jgi:hypothetical protein
VNSVDSEFFTILNDDDFLVPDFFRIALEGFRQFPRAGIFAGRLIHWNARIPDETKSYRGLQPGYYAAPSACLRSLRELATHTWTAMMFRSEVLSSTRGVDPKAGYAADMHFVLRVMALHDTIVSDIHCAVYCMHPGSSSYAGWVRSCAGSLLYIHTALERDPALFVARYPLLAAYAKTCRAKMRRAALESLAHNDLDGARAAAEFLLRFKMLRLYACAVVAATRTGARGAALRFALKSVHRLRHSTLTTSSGELESLVRSVLDRISSGKQVLTSK